MPSPEQLGVRKQPPANDWAAVHKRMDALEVATFQVDRVNADIVQFTCLLQGEAGKTHRIEAQGATDIEAAQRALDEAQRWREGRR